jgi:hypothetical protein
MPDSTSVLQGVSPALLLTALWNLRSFASLNNTTGTVGLLVHHGGAPAVPVPAIAAVSRPSGGRTNADAFYLPFGWRRTGPSAPGSCSAGP